MTGDLVLENCRLLDGAGQADGLDVEIEAGRISRIGPAGHANTASTGAGFEQDRIDASDWVVAPGLIDLQVNGGWSHDLTTDPEAIWTVGRQLATTGVTAWLPTLVSADLATRRKALSVLESGPPPGWQGAVPVGWHFEGPFLNPRRRGAHEESALQTVPASFVDEPLPALMTIAPELSGALEAIERLRSAGVVVSVGHTEASPHEVHTAMARGATMGTHLFNAMTGLHHRSPGAAAGLLNSTAMVSLITDGHHVDPEMVRLVHALAPDRVILVSDAMAALGLPEGTSRLGRREVTVSDGAVRIADGTLAGSATPLMQCLFNYREITGCPLTEAVRAASGRPAQALNLVGRGAVAQGARADLTVFDHDDNHVTTFVAGVEAPATTS